MGELGYHFAEVEFKEGLLGRGCVEVRPGWLVVRKPGIPRLLVLVITIIPAVALLAAAARRWFTDPRGWFWEAATLIMMLWVAAFLFLWAHRAVVIEIPHEFYADVPVWSDTGGDDYKTALRELGVVTMDWIFLSERAEALWKEVRGLDPETGDVVEERMPFVEVALCRRASDKQVQGLPFRFRYLYFMVMRFRNEEDAWRFHEVYSGV
ncbi:MAG TPA: hypothetical protein VMZ92_11840 [Planctomycetota bacterium]|nr:hypothetical protein [Planctomycetota bacterium]